MIGPYSYDDLKTEGLQLIERYHHADVISVYRLVSLDTSHLERTIYFNPHIVVQLYRGEIR